MSPTPRQAEILAISGQHAMWWSSIPEPLTAPREAWQAPSVWAYAERLAA